MPSDVASLAPSCHMALGVATTAPKTTEPSMLTQEDPTPCAPRDWERKTCSGQGCFCLSVQHHYTAMCEFNKLNINYTDG